MTCLQFIALFWNDFVSPSGFLSSLSFPTRRTFLVTTLDLPSELISFYDSINFFLPPMHKLCATYYLNRELTTDKKSGGIFSSVQFEDFVWISYLDVHEEKTERLKNQKVTIFGGCYSYNIFWIHLCVFSTLQ